MKEVNDVSIAAQNKLAAKIELEAKKWGADHPEFTQHVEQLSQKRDNNDSLFLFFLECVKKGEHIKASYILNCCFDSPRDRANFGNRRDEQGNTAYHYAAQLGLDQIVIVLNDERRRDGEFPKIRFVITNGEGKKPLDLVCENAHESTFDLMWARMVKKTNKNPLHALESARRGGSQHIIGQIMENPAVKKALAEREAKGKEEASASAVTPQRAAAKKSVSQGGKDMSSEVSSKMASTPSGKKTKRAEKKEGLETSLATLRANLASKDAQNFMKNLSHAVTLIQSQADAKSILECGISKKLEFVSDKDSRQQLICLKGKIKEKAGLYDEALQEWLEIAVINNEAMESVLALCKNNFYKIKGNNKIEAALKAIESFLKKNEKSLQPEIILLRAVYATSKLHDVQVRMNSAGMNQKPKWQTILKDSLLELRKIPQIFFQIFDFHLKGTDKNSISPLESERFFEIVFSLFEGEGWSSDIKIISGCLEAYKKTELYKQQKLKDEVQALEEKIIEKSEINPHVDEISKFFSENSVAEANQVFSDDKSVTFDKTTVARLAEEAMKGEEASMEQLLVYAENKDFSARPEALESVGRVYLAVGKFKSGGKGPFEYSGKKGPAKFFSEARKAFEKFYKKDRRSGIYYDLALRYYEGRLFKKNAFLARRILEEGRQRRDLSLKSLILLAKMYFWGEGGIEKFKEADDILQALDDQKNLQSEPEALYILAEYKYLFYLNAKVDEKNGEAARFFEQSQLLFKRAAEGGYEDANICMRLFEDSNGLKPMEEEPAEEDRRDLNNEPANEDKVNDDEEGSFAVGRLLAKLCDALRAHDCDETHPKVQSIKTELFKWAPSYVDCTPKNFFAQLENLEKKHVRYFDSDPSEDSDSERDQEYHTNDKLMSADKHDANKIIGKLRKYTQDCLFILEQSEENKLADTYKDRASEFKSKYVPEFKSMEVNKNPSLEARRDLETVMDYAARGELAEALAQISTPFYVAQTRGIHFFRNKWSRKDRHKFKDNLFSEKHPMKSQAIYSASVHVLAEVTDRFPGDRLSQLKLQQAARCLTYRLDKLRECEPHPHEELPNKLRTDSIKGRHYRNRLMQVQQLYSAKYDAFLEDYLAWELEQKPHYFVNQEMHFVSTADLQSKHSSEYALGNKVYPSKEIYRLRPRYGEQVRATRNQMGAVYLTLHPLEDYLPERNNHIPSLNVKGEIELSDEIVSERESTFLGSIPKGRLAYIEHMRFPSFHHEEYLEVMRLRYGLDKELYTRFKKLLESSKPHDAKNRLTVLLLGEHISAFKTLWLQKRADKIVRNLGHYETVKDEDELNGVHAEMKEKDAAKTVRPYLLFRTPMGNFSFFPDQPYAASQKGDDPYLRSRRLQTAHNKKKWRQSSEKKSTASQTQTRENRNKSQHEFIRTLGDGNCAFNAVTLGVCELLEQGLLPENDFFDLEFAQKLNLMNHGRDDVIKALKTIQDSEERQRRFQLIIRKIAIMHIETEYDEFYRDEYHEHLQNAFNDFIDPENSQKDDIFCVHNFILEKFTEEDLTPEALLVWWEEEGKRVYFDILREPGKDAWDRAHWGSEIEIDALAKFLKIKIFWESSLTRQKVYIGIDDEEMQPLFGVYFRGAHWSYVRFPCSESVLNPEDQKDGSKMSSQNARVALQKSREAVEKFGDKEFDAAETRHAEKAEDEGIRSDADYEEQRKSSQRGLNF